MMKRIVLMVTVAVIVAMILAAGAASAQQPVSVQIAPNAQVIAGGQTLLVTVEVACEPGLEVLEAHVDVQQGATFRQAGIGSVECDGKSHVHKVRVTALEGQNFSSGEASVSAFVLVIDPQTTPQTTHQAQASETVSVVGRPPQ
jgi:hypothetical protein